MPIEDFTDQFEFRIFGEEYLKYRHFLVVNQFIRIKIIIRQGWTNSETGRVGSPRVQFLSFEMLYNTIEKNAKKLILQLDVKKIKYKKIIPVEGQLKRF